MKILEKYFTKSRYAESKGDIYNALNRLLRKENAWLDPSGFIRMSRKEDRDEIYITLFQVTREAVEYAEGAYARKFKLQIIWYITPKGKYRYFACAPKTYADLPWPWHENDRWGFPWLTKEELKKEKKRRNTCDCRRYRKKKKEKTSGNIS